MGFKVALLDGPGGPGNIEERVLSAVGAEVVRPRPEVSGELERIVEDANAILCDATAITPALL